MVLTRQQKGLAFVYRLLRWLGWSVLISVSPLVGLGILRFVDVHGWPGLDSILGSGSLLLTSVALISGGIREMASMPSTSRSRRRDVLFFASLSLAIILAMTYGGLADNAIRSPGSQVLDLPAITAVSLVFFGVSVIVTGAAVAVSASIKEEERA